MPYPHKVVCKESGCEESFSDHREGHIAAHKAGWFHERNRNSWCPKHNPAWVKDWRLRRKKGL